MGHTRAARRGEPRLCGAARPVSRPVDPGGDPGVFLTVAGRLLHGDHLYRGVWDNKDHSSSTPTLPPSGSEAGGGRSDRHPLGGLAAAPSRFSSTARRVRRRDRCRVRRLPAARHRPVVLRRLLDAGGSCSGAACRLAVGARGARRRRRSRWGWESSSRSTSRWSCSRRPWRCSSPGARSPAPSTAARASSLVRGTLALAAVLLAARGELIPVSPDAPDQRLLRERRAARQRTPGGIHGHIRMVETSTRHARTVLRRPAVALCALGLVAFAVAREGSVAGDRGAAGRGRGGDRRHLGATAAWDHHVQMLAYAGVVPRPASSSAASIGRSRRLLRWRQRARRGVRRDSCCSAMLPPALRRPAPRPGSTGCTAVRPRHSSRCAPERLRDRGDVSYAILARTTRRLTAPSSAAAGRFRARAFTSIRGRRQRR